MLPKSGANPNADASALLKRPVKLVNTGTDILVVANAIQELVSIPYTGTKIVVSASVLSNTHATYLGFGTAKIVVVNVR